MQNEIDPFRENEFPELSPIKKKRFARIHRILRAAYSSLAAISPIAGTLALVLAIAAIFFGYPVYENFKYTDPASDGYVAPRSPGDIVDIAQRSTVTVICKLAEDDFIIGSGWAIDLPTSNKKFKTSLITNHHVIDDCIDGKAELIVLDEDIKEYLTVIDVYDVKNDLAKLSSTVEIEPLQLSNNLPYPGYWVMNYGTADGWIGSVAFGTVLNFIDSEIFITANTSEGNSGGPLLDNEGRVIGTTSWVRIDEQYNGAKSLDAMCAKILVCKYGKGKRYWE
jgi:S1-C subfamily serine protease